jgi:hypothetical protein
MEFVFLFVFVLSYIQSQFYRMYCDHCNIISTIQIMGLFTADSPRFLLCLYTYNTLFSHIFNLRSPLGINYRFSYLTKDQKNYVFFCTLLFIVSVDLG